MSAAASHAIVPPLPRLLPQPALTVAQPAPARILFISSHPATASCGAAIADALQIDVEIACNRRSGLAALRRGEYTLILLEDDLATLDPSGCDLLWQNAGLALPIEIDLAHSGLQRILRDVRAGLARRHREHTLARLAASQRIESELKSSLAGLLLQSELALREPCIPPHLFPRLRRIADLAVDMRKHLQSTL